MSYANKIKISNQLFVVECIFSFHISEKFIYWVKIPLLISFMLYVKCK